MAMVSPFGCRIRCEELSPISESEFDEVQAMIAAESENFVVVNGKVQHKPEPPSRGRIGGIEL
ncbi:MAG: hypothetical protein ACJ74J_05360 [Blastocatellia bacterium]